MYLLLMYLMVAQSLHVPNLKKKLQGKEIASIATYMDGVKRHSLTFTPWKDYPYKPQVDFAIAHAEDFIYLKYYVTEKNMRAVNTDPNSPVYEDSCVEFFISFDDTGYYNFECNSLGAFLLYFGKDLQTRKPLPKEVIEKIQTFSTLQKNVKENTYSWTITWAIPKTTFTQHPNLKLSGQEFSANFYKCGDKLPEPHYVSWSNIGTEKPNFHTPQYFGKVVFE